jgi:PHD/YefM family antitoxin component YafN of YafNO toxin-antitoxin module
MDTSYHRSEKNDKPNIIIYTYTLDIYIFQDHTINIRRPKLMEEVNALKIRNNLGEILDRLDATGEPILVSKGRKLRAVLVSPQDFKTRFLDYKVKEDKKRLLDEMHALKRKKKEPVESIELLRQLRGYNE